MLENSSGKNSSVDIYCGLYVLNMGLYRFRSWVLLSRRVAKINDLINMRKIARGEEFIFESQLMMNCWRSLIFMKNDLPNNQIGACRKKHARDGASPLDGLCGVHESKERPKKNLQSIHSSRSTFFATLSQTYSIHTHLLSDDVLFMKECREFFVALEIFLMETKRRDAFLSIVQWRVLWFNYAGLSGYM